MTPIAFAATESLERTFEEDVQAADDCSIEVLIERYRQLIYGIALSGTGNAHDAEDVFQETFLALVRSKKTFASEEHLKAWLIRVVLNQCKKKYYHEQKYQPTKKETIDYLVEQTKEEADNGSEHLHEMLYTLSEKYRKVIVLYYMEEMTTKEIANILRISESTVRKRLQRGRDMLRQKGEGQWER